MISFAPPAATPSFETAEGRIVVWFPVPGVAAARMLGYVTGDLARKAYELTDEQPTIPYEGFLDFSETTGFDWEARGRALKWNLMHLSPKMRLHLLVHTPPMLLATKVFQRALRDKVETHTDPMTFASAYELAVKRHRARVAHPE